VSGIVIFSGEEAVAKAADFTPDLLVSDVNMSAMNGVEAATLFTTSRVLCQWGERGFISPRRESVVVRDSFRLELVSAEL
jgi:DNA-binding NarL/FixJ family response regulator